MRKSSLRELVEWGESWTERFFQTQPPLCSGSQQEAFQTALELAHKVLNDRDPKVGDKLVSLTDTDARRGKHGEYYDGYLFDVSLDADSELICGVDLLPANGDEAANAQSARTIFKRSTKRRERARRPTSTNRFAKNILESNES